MLVDTKPTTFDELIRISGLSHGTDVWLNNAQSLIEAGTIKLDEAICCRDDIMIYLIKKGLEPQPSFKIMEAVRKGKVAKGKEPKWPEYEKMMKDNNVTRKDLESLIRIALKRLYDNDNYLICKQILMQFIIQKEVLFFVLEYI